MGVQEVERMIDQFRIAKMGSKGPKNTFYKDEKQSNQIETRVQTGQTRVQPESTSSPLRLHTRCRRKD